MFKFSVVAFCLAVALAGCDEKVADLPSPGGEIGKVKSFALPGSTYRLETKRNDTTNGKLDYIFSPTTWKPKGWSLWVASNVYSDASQPGTDPNWKTKWKEGRSAVVRSTHDDGFLSGVKAFVKANNVNLEINYLGYDYLPQSLVNDYPRSRGQYFSAYGEKCEKAFKRCVDNYYLSPLDRYRGGSRTAYKDWVEPYFHFGTGQIDKSDKEMFVSKGGAGDEKSEFYDWWPTMVFLVNPDGQVARAWMPQTFGPASVGQVEAALIEDMNISNPKVDPSTSMYQPAIDSYYGKYFIESGIENLMETLSRILNK